MVKSYFEYRLTPRPKFFSIPQSPPISARFCSLAEWHGNSSVGASVDTDPTFCAEKPDGRTNLGEAGGPIFGPSALDQFCDKA